jgi:hypothetical protein
VKRARYDEVERKGLAVDDGGKKMVSPTTLLYFVEASSPTNRPHPLPAQLGFFWRP